MKKKVFALVAGLLAGSFLLSGCSQAKEANIESETSAGYSSILEDNGYYTGVKALDIVQLPEDYADVIIPEEYLTVSDDTVDGYIKDMMTNLDMTQPVADRAAQEGDIVTIDYVGTIGGAEFEGGSAENYKVELGSGTLIDDFEGQIIGHALNDQFDVTITFPEGYGETQDSEGNTIDLSNETAVFSVTLKNIAVFDLTDDAVAAAFGTDYTLDDGSIVDTVEKARQYFTEYARYKAATTYLTNYLMSNAVFTQDIPDEILEHERVMEKDYLEKIAEQEGMALEEVLAAGGYDDMDGYLQDSEAYIVQDVKYCLIIQALAETEKIVVTDADMQEAYGSELDAAVNTYGKGFVAQQTLALKVMDHLVEATSSK